MTVVVTHTTPADSTFSSTGAAAWNADHTLAGVGTMAEQNANAVAITGGTINGTTIGATTPAAGTFTTLTAQTEVLKGTGQNLTLQSQTFANAAWGKSNASITSSTATAPDSTSTACTLTEDTATTLHYINQPARTIVSGTTITLSAYVKANGRNFCALYDGSVAQGKYFNITAGGGGSVLGNFISAPTSAALTYVGNDWYRISIVVTSVSQFTFGIYLSPDGTSFSYTGNGTSGINIWGAQTELGGTLNTYIPTTTTAIYGTPTLSFSGVAGLGLQSDGSLYASSAGTGAVRFYTNNIGQEQMRVSNTASAVNYHQLTGSATGSGPIHSVAGSDTNIDLNLTTKGTGAVNLNTGNGTAVRVADFGGAVVAGLGVFAGSSAQNTVYVSPYGSGAGSNLVLASKGTGFLVLATNTSNNAFATEQMRVTHTASTVNFVQVTGAATGGRSVISAQGSDTNTGLSFTSKGTARIAAFFNNNATSSFHFSVGVGGSTSAVNYLDASGSATGTGPALSAQGSDTNIDLNLTTKGTGNIKFNNSGGTFANFTSTGGTLVSYPEFAGSQFPNVAFFGVGGTGANISLQIGSKGTGAVIFQTAFATQFQIANTTSAVNYVQVTGAVTAGPPTISAQGSDTNIGLNLSTKGTGGFNFASSGNSIFSGNGGTHFRVRTDIASASTFWEVFGSTGGPIFRSTATTAQIQTSGGTLSLQTDNSGTTQLNVAHTASAVNFVQVTGGSTTNNASISTAGSDTNVGLTFQTKAAGSYAFITGGGRQVDILNVNSAVNRMTLVGSATGTAPTIAVVGSDTNIDLAFTPKGTGNVRFGTHTGTADTAVSGYIEIKDSGGTVRKLAVIT
jgi:hypothetical protein